MKIATAISTFRRSEDGAILVFVAVCLAVMLGMAALAFDFGRVTVTQSELQSYADNVALAAAGELDGHTDSITRATNAAAEMIRDSQTFGTRDENQTQELSGVTDYELFFYELPGDPNIEPAQPGQLLDASDPASAFKASFVRVAVASHEVETPLAAAMASLIDNPYEFASVRAEAVAGFTLSACDITPMFFCLPQPGLDVVEGQLVKMVSQGGGNAQWGPGNFGFLAAGDNFAIDESGACEPAPPGQEDSCALAASRSVGQCFSQRGVETKPGLSVGNMIAGFNTRFDIYNATSKQYQNESKFDVDNFAAAPNVLDGWVTQAQGNNCVSEESPPLTMEDPDDPTAMIPNPAATVGLPLDDCFNNPTGLCAGGRIGTGEFGAGLQQYLEVNYGVDYSGGTPVGIPPWLQPVVADPDVTRLDIYNAEIDNQFDLQARLEALGKAESSEPSCQPPSLGAADPDRRVIAAAGINCNAYESQLNGGSGVIPVSKFVRMFLIRPSETDGTGANAVIYGEVIETIDSGAYNNGAGGILHDVVQLYR